MKTVVIKKAAQDIHQEIITWRRELHTIPELSFELHLTSKYVRQQLDKMHIPYRTAAITGIIALIQGGNPGPTIALRADMDALNIVEEVEVDYYKGFPATVNDEFFTRKFVKSALKTVGEKGIVEIKKPSMVNEDVNGHDKIVINGHEK